MDPRPKEKAGLVQRDLVGILQRYHAILKIGKVYDFYNQMVQNQIQQLHARLSDALEREGEVVLRVRENSIYVNGARVKFNYSNYHVYKLLSADFQAKQIAAISFSPEMPEDELQRFV